MIPVLKKWGFISALPSEYLIHFRKGNIHKKNSGQGSICFKRPRDTIFIIPTSLKEIIFQANQLTADNVDVRIRGMAVYRISDPLKIYKLINFSNRARAEEKLAKMIGDMCRSTAKWLVANMEIGECMRKRKEEIADSLRQEVSQVVADAEKGWGVEIITIDIQDVYIQDEEIFSAMQMLFKADKLKESKMAELEMQENLSLKKLESDKILANHRKENELNKAQIEAEIRDEQIKLNRQNEEKQFELDQYRVEQNESIANYKLKQDIEKEKERMKWELEKTQQEVEKQKMLNDEELKALREKIKVENTITPVSLEKNFIENALPEIAKVVSQNMRDVKMNIMQQDGQGGNSPFYFILMELMQILKDRNAIVRSENEDSI